MNQYKKSLSQILCALAVMLAAALIAPLTACQLEPATVRPNPWTYASLRALDTVDAPAPTLDLIALYLRSADSILQIRLDVLDLTSEVDSDLTLAFNTDPNDSVQPGEVTWDAQIVIPADGPIQTLGQDGQPIARSRISVSRDPFLDTLVVSVAQQALPGVQAGFSVQACLAPAKQNGPGDCIGPVRSDALPPARVPVMIAFWNAFPALTPSQALRAWHGAHSGPERQRHGLRYLLEAVEASGVPVTLLDLKTPTALAALDYVGALPRIQEMAQRGLPVLPDVLPALIGPGAGFTPPEWVYTQLAADNRQAGLDFGLPASTIQAIPRPYFPNAPIAETSPQANTDGPSLEVRRQLVSRAAESSQDVLFLGGDFATSSWGIPANVRATLEYLAAHPWVEPLGAEDLARWNVQLDDLDPTAASAGPAAERMLYTAQGEPTPSGLNARQIQERLLQTFEQAPANPAKEAAWQAYRALLTAPEPVVKALSANYLAPIGHLLAAARWNENPTQRSDCSSDLDWDGQPECVLASETVFAVIEPEKGNVTVAFIRSGEGMHQIIGAGWQVAIGQSDPMLWDPQRGVAGDPTALAGAFVDAQTAPVVYSTWTLSDEAISFVDTTSSVQKTLRITDQGLRAEYRSERPTSVQISLCLDPWQRFTPGWAEQYQEELFPWGRRWGQANGFGVEIRTAAPITWQSSITSRPLIQEAEDPNYSYPAGHFMAFPLASATIQAEGEWWVEVRMK